MSYVDEELLVDEWVDGPQRQVLRGSLAAGSHEIVVEYMNALGPASIEVRLRLPARAG